MAIPAVVFEEPLTVWIPTVKIKTIVITNVGNTVINEGIMSYN